MELYGVGMGLMVVWQTLFWTLLGLVAPVFWVWMLVDAIVREEYEYPNATTTSNNKLLWVLLLVFVHIAAVFYFFMVFVKVKRGSVPRPAQVASIPPAATQVA